MRTLTILTFAAFIAIPTFVAAQSMTAQQHHKEYSEHLIGDGWEMFEHTAKLSFEGIVSKSAQAPYRSDRSEGWLKIKTVQKGKFPVIGFAKEPTGVVALYLGKREGKDLVYMGKVVTGRAKSESSLIPS
jgi:bifunctional non-homologous end joining protein LigD